MGNAFESFAWRQAGLLSCCELCLYVASKRTKLQPKRGMFSQVKDKRYLAGQCARVMFSCNIRVEKAILCVPLSEMCIGLRSLVSLFHVPLEKVKEFN